MLQFVVLFTSLAMVSMVWLAVPDKAARQQQIADEATGLYSAGFERFDRAYQALTEEAEGVPPAPTEAADGGAEAWFLPKLRFLPRAPEGFGWSYGVQLEADPLLEGRHYICASAELATAEQWGAVPTIAHVAAAGPLVRAHYCGALTDAAPPSGWPAPVAVTFYLTYEAPEPPPPPLD